MVSGVAHTVSGVVHAGEEAAEREVIIVFLLTEEEEEGEGGWELEARGDSRLGEMGVVGAGEDPPRGERLSLLFPPE